MLESTVQQEIFKLINFQKTSAVRRFKTYFQKTKQGCS